MTLFDDSFKKMRVSQNLLLAHPQDNYFIHLKRIIQ